MNGPPIENGAVAISGDRIVDLGPVGEIKARHPGKMTDLGECALLPGLINAHCHLDYTCLRGRIARQKTFTDWIRAINAEKSRLSAEDYIRSINDGLAEARRFGTTAVVNFEAFPELISRIKGPIRTWWFAELIDIRDPDRANEVVNLAVELLKSAEHWGLAPHAPFTASANLFRRCEEIAGRENVLLATHLAESSEEMQMSLDLASPLADFLSGINPDLFECEGQTPVEHVLRNVARLDGRWLVVHLNSVRDGDLKLLAQQSTKCHVVHCPRSHAYFEHEPFQFERLRELGFNICLGTDSLASTDDLSLLAEMREFQKNVPKVPAEEILAMATRNPAEALGQSDRLGRLSPGYLADLIAIPVGARPETWCEEAVSFEGGVPWIMTGGEAQA